jgi:hypothetical protein
MKLELETFPLLKILLEKKVDNCLQPLASPDMLVRTRRFAKFHCD